MDLLVSLGISIGVLIAVWVYVAVGMPDLGLIVWAGIVAWGTFYAAGGGTEGLKKTIASNLAGETGSGRWCLSSVPRKALPA